MVVKYLVGAISEWIDCIVVDDCLFISSLLSEQKCRNIILQCGGVSR